MGNFGLVIRSIVWLICLGGVRQSVPATEPRWPLEKQAGQFLIHCDTQLDVPEDLLLEMQQLAPGIARLLGITLTDKTVHVVLFSSEYEYRRYMQHYFPRLPHRRALFIQDRGPGMLFAHRHDDLRTDLRHECAHALLNNADRPLPLWVDEGLAEYFEVVDIDQRNRHPHVADMQQRTSQGFVPALDELEKLDTVESMGTGQYRDSWAWVHFLLHRRPETRELLTNFLTRQRSGEEALPLSRTIAMRIPQWRTEFIEHFQSLR